MTYKFVLELLRVPMCLSNLCMDSDFWIKDTLKQGYVQSSGSKDLSSGVSPEEGERLKWRAL